MYIMQNPNVCHIKSDGSYEGSVGAIKMVVDPDEHTQTNTLSGTQSPNAVLHCVRQETVVSRKMHVVSNLHFYFKVSTSSLKSLADKSKSYILEWFR